MGYPRTHLVVPGTAGTYHCVARCVRRAFLCGEDTVSGRCFDHRKTWLESRLIELAGIFSISVLAYAVMSNHVHAVLHCDPALSSTWSDDEVAARWVQLFPVRVNGHIEPEACRRKAWVLSGNATRIALLRQRLGDLSWFMRCLSEPLARLANEEDRCTGRFWEGRYRCQALLDNEAVLACMTYVDLNPVRAGIAHDLPESVHTSVHARLGTNPEDQDQPIAAVAGPAMPGFLPLSTRQYIAVVDWSGRQLHPHKRGHIASDTPPPLLRGTDGAQWLAQVRGIESRYCRAIGSARALLDKAREMGQRWLMVRRVERSVSQAVNSSIP